MTIFCLILIILIPAGLSLHVKSSIKINKFADANFYCSIYLFFLLLSFSRKSFYSFFYFYFYLKLDILDFIYWTTYCTYYSFDTIYYTPAHSIKMNMVLTDGSTCVICYRYSIWIGSDGIRTFVMLNNNRTLGFFLYREAKIYYNITVLIWLHMLSKSKYNYSRELAFSQNYTLTVMFLNN